MAVEMCKPALACHAAAQAVLALDHSIRHGTSAVPTYRTQPDCGGSGTQSLLPNLLIVCWRADSTFLMPTVDSGPEEKGQPGRPIRWCIRLYALTCARRRMAATSGNHAAASSD